ncbi:MAG: hypothetical protein ABIQ89_01840 [Candidatus Saccharimonadales bacterium]
MSNEKDQITVNRAKIDSITVYEVNEYELEVIERGSPSSNYLNIALVLLSTFVAFLANLLLTPVNGNTFTVFVIITVVSAVTGIILLYIWHRTNKDSSSIFTKIRARKSVEKIREIALDSEVVANEQESVVPTKP